MRFIFPLVAFLELAHCFNDDLFNYRETVDRDFGPAQWNKVTCDDVDTCTGWPDDWKLGNGWKLNGNTCRHCPAGTAGCGNHHQSPINLERNRAIEGHSNAKECIDVHWMKYEDSTCTWDHLEQEDAFTIERHALKITQPLEWGTTDDNSRIKCPSEKGRRFGRIDFSKGFSQWWFLSHIDFKVPSEHTQEGKRYSAEVQMAHFYSVTGEVAGVDNEMATISVFLQAYDDSPPYPFLDRLICEWREAEDKTRQQCGKKSVNPYPGCFNPGRGHTPIPTAPVKTPEPTSPAPSGLTQTVEPVELPGAPTSALDPTAAPTTAPAPETTAAPGTDAPVTIVSPERAGGANVTRRFLRNRSANDILVDNWEKQEGDQGRITLDPENFRPADKTDEEWGEWVEAYSAHGRGDATEQQRNLLEKNVIPFHNYQFLIDCKTEYYFRYSGTQTVPPCYGPFTPGSRGNTNHWRVMKDPIRVHPRQIAEMERLLKERIAPPDAAKHACENDTAGKIDEEGHISVARPLMATANGHYKVFCECDDWSSKWPEDRAWCKSKDQKARLYDHPYNFATGKF